MGLLLLFSPSWWKYVLDDSRADDEYGPYDTWFRHLRWGGECVSNPFARFSNYLSRCRCRWRGHPAGVVWMNVGGFEPDMTCRGCGEDLG